MYFFLCLDESFTFFALGALDGIVDDAQRLLFGVGDLFLIVLRLLVAVQNTSKNTNEKSRRQADDKAGYIHLIPPVSTFASIGAAGLTVSRWYIKTGF